MVQFVPVRRWDLGGGAAGQGQWVLPLPRGEDALACAVGREWCAVATSQRMLRMFGPSGTQEAPLMLPGPVVLMAGRGALLLVVYAMAPGSAR